MMALSVAGTCASCHLAFSGLNQHEPPGVVPHASTECHTACLTYGAGEDLTFGYVQIRADITCRDAEAVQRP